MKSYLICFILLICVLPVRAQDSSEVAPERVLAYDSAIPLFEEGKSDSLYKNEYVVRVLLGLYEEYEKECRKDSTDIGIIIENDTNVIYSCLVYGCTDEHNTPPTTTYFKRVSKEPTFQDFMEYLKRKIKH